MREYAHEVPRLYKLREEPHEKQKAQEKQLAGLRTFAKHVERFLDQINQRATAPGNFRPTPVLEQASVPLGHVPGASASSNSSRPPSHLPTSRPSTASAPSVPKESSIPRENPSSGPGKRSVTHFSTVRSNVKSGAIRIDIANPEEWTAGDIAVLRNQEAKRVRDVGSLIFETPIQHDYEAGIIAVYRAARRNRWILSQELDSHG